MANAKRKDSKRKGGSSGRAPAESAAPTPPPATPGPPAGAGAPPSQPPPNTPYDSDNIGAYLARRSIADAFLDDDPKRRERLGIPNDETTPTPIMVELNLRHAKGLPGAEKQFLELFKDLFKNSTARTEKPSKIAETYYRCMISLDSANQLITADEVRDGKPTTTKERAIYRIWPDFDVRPQILEALATIKADAAARSFDATGHRIAWAVIDSGVDANHPHFEAHDTLGGDVADLHWDFTAPDGTSDEERIRRAMTDGRGHGTHVAGIIAGGLLPQRLRAIVEGDGAGKPPLDVRVASMGATGFQERPIDETDLVSGVAPRCKIVSLKVLPDGPPGRNTDSSSNVLRALQHVRQKINGEGKILRVHGVNLSVGYEFDAKWFACGQSPICVEVDRLVRSGVVVVVAAGNTGYGNLTSREGVTSTGLALTINDPGNASLAITVGATHRDMPYTYGVSFFSSKGPTGDGRPKPDLVAPGERIASCATGAFLNKMHPLLEQKGAEPGKRLAAYIEENGTSMAAPHVSGAVAAFLSIRREFVGRPEEVKRIFLQTATSLGRERYFEGHGLVDLMRAIQSV